MAIDQAGAENFRGYTNSYRSTTNVSGGSAHQVIAPAENVNGIIVESLEFVTENAGGAGYYTCGFLAKATAPTSATDGDSILAPNGAAIVTGSRVIFGATNKPLKIPAGKGLYFFTASSESSASRSCLYRVL